MIFFQARGSCPRGGTIGRWRCLGGQNKFDHGYVAYQIDWDDEQNGMQLKFLPFGQTGDLGLRSKGQIYLNFSYKVNCKDIYTKPCVCLHK